MARQRRGGHGQFIGPVESFLRDLEVAGEAADNRLRQAPAAVQDIGDCAFAEAKRGYQVLGQQVAAGHEGAQ